MENKPVQIIKILLVDDHQMVIDGLKSILRYVKNIDIAAEANNGKDALEILKQKPFDLVITDISMPEMTGIALTEEIKKEYPDLKVLILTMYKNKEFIKEIINAQADGYILKDSGKDELINAIHKIMDNGTNYYSDDIIPIITSIIQEGNVGKTVIGNEKNQNLTEREIDRATIEICSFLNCERKDIALKLCQREIEELVIEWVDGNAIKAHHYGYRIKS